MMIDDDSRRFASLVSQAVKDPDNCDRTALLNAASAFLDAAEGEGPLAEIARSLAHGAMDWSLEFDFDDHLKMSNSYLAFDLALQAEELGDTDDR